MNTIKVLMLLVLSLCAQVATGRVHTAIGGNFDAPSTWQDGIVPSCNGGETVIVTARANLIGNVPCFLGSRTSPVGPAIHLLAGSSFTPLANVLITLRGFDRTANFVALIDLGAQFTPQAGAIIRSDCAVDGNCEILNHGVIQSSNVTWTIPNSNVNWNNSGSYHVTFDGLLDSYNLPNVWAAQLARPWISNSEGTGLGSSTDSSVTLSGQLPGTMLTEVASLALVNSPGTYYVNYDAGVMYWYQTQPGGAIFTVHYKYLSFIGSTIVSTDNATGNQAIFDHSTFQYMGTIAAQNAFVINAAYKQSASVGANRLLQVTNNTFRYCSRVVGFTGPVTGTASDPILLNGNTIYAVWGDGFGSAFSVSMTSSSYVSVRNNIVPDGLWGAPFLVAKTVGTPTTLTGWIVQGNIARVSAFQSDVPAAIVWPDSVMSGNFIMGFSAAFDGREIAGFGGTPGHPTTISRNVFVHPHRVLNVVSYQQFLDNYVADYDHHGIDAPSAQTDQMVAGISILRNIFTNGGTNSAVQLGYVTRVWMDNVTIAQNTSIQKSAAGLEFGDGGDNDGSWLMTNLNIYNNLFPASAYGAIRPPDSRTGMSRVHIVRADWSDFYQDTVTYLGLKTFSTFTWNGGEYDTSTTRNIKGVSLGDTSYTSPQSGLTLAWTYTGPTNVTLAWNHGTPVQLVGYSGNATAATNSSLDGIAGLYAGTLTDSSQNFPTLLNSATTPTGMWVKITGGRGLGQMRRVTLNTAQVLTVVPAWTTVPDTSSTYVLFRAEVRLYDTSGANYVVAGIDLRSTPAGSATDVGIGLLFNTVNVDPRFVNSSASWRSWDTAQGGVGNEDSIFHRLSGNPALVFNLAAYEKLQFSPTNNTLSHGFANQYIGASPVGGVGP